MLSIAPTVESARNRIFYKIHRHRGSLYRITKNTRNYPIHAIYRTRSGHALDESLQRSHVQLGASVSQWDVLRIFTGHGQLAQFPAFPWPHRSTICRTSWVCPGRIDGTSKNRQVRQPRRHTVSHRSPQQVRQDLQEKSHEIQKRQDYVQLRRACEECWRTARKRYLVYNAS